MSQSLEERIQALEEALATHIGLDWGASGVNYPHPNMQVSVAEFGGGASRLDSNGIQIVDAAGSGYIWFVDEFQDDPDYGNDLAYITGQVTDTQSALIFGGTANGNLDSAEIEVVADSTPTINMRVGSPDNEGIIDIACGTAFGRISFKGVIVLDDEDLTTISAGVISPLAYTSRIKVGTEGAAASDDLDTITATNFLDGSLLIVRARNDAQTVVMKDATGNLSLAGDFSLTHTRDTITLMYDSSAAAWLELCRSDNTA
jgi:hypothetical protein